MHTAVAPCRPAGDRPALEIADIFRTHGAAYRQRHTVDTDQRAAMHAIETCRTAALGGHVDVCDTCGHERPAYNSCRNRHCPKCQSLRQAQWIQQRLTRLLPTHYFHVVFTLPAVLRPLAHRNRQRIFTLLFHAAAQTLLTPGRDPARLGVQLGITSVLHTWTRELQFHPHVHCIVTGGGLTVDRRSWKSARRRYLFPVKVLSRLFRGKFLAALGAAYRNNELQFGGSTQALADASAFQRLVDELHRSEWVVYAKRPFGGPQQVFRYLGRYTHRVGISNQRLQAIDADGVRFATKGGRSITLPPQTFIRRFLLHVLPAGFVKIRHYGLLAAGNATTQLEHARALLQLNSTPDHTGPTGSGALDWQTRLLQLTGVDLTRCPHCSGGRMIRHALPPIGFARPPHRGPPPLGSGA
ncbi:MAG TPA: IS91 family transposase [Burkholderiales bacterium]|nr:IS91 family transposase [Burkholderiales bacterium]